MDEQKTSNVFSGEEETLPNGSGIIAEQEEVIRETPSAPPVKAKPEKKEKKAPFIFNVYDLASIVMAAFIIIAVCFSFVFRMVEVKGESMTNTLQDGDWLVAVQKSEYERGDIIIITQPNYFNEPLIKRVIATEGQTINIDYASSTVFIDGQPIDEPYLRESFINQKTDDRPLPYTVPEGYLFCMGDNRNGSTDSRSVLVGDIDARYVLGKAEFRLLPFTGMDIYDYE